MVIRAIPKIRPRFVYPLKHSRERALYLMETEIKNTDLPIEGVILGNHVILDVVKKERHFWSPQMNFRFTNNDVNPAFTHVKGIIGPRPAVWTFFIFIYFLIGTLGFLLSSYGLAKWSLGQQSLYFWSFPFALLIMLTAFFVGKAGERLGKEQVELLIVFVKDALKIY
jgi:hypothetical protein